MCVCVNIQHAFHELCIKVGGLCTQCAPHMTLSCVKLMHKQSENVISVVKRCFMHYSG